jgi:hypothetical protein
MCWLWAYKVDADAASMNEAFPPGVARPALRALHAAGLTQLRQLTEVREEDLAQLHGMGPKALAALRKGPEKSGLSIKGK